jgi:hypothetical protein
MLAASSQDWNVFKQIFTEHWDGFTHVYPRYNTPYYDDLVAKMLGCGNPEKMGSLEYRCLHCGQGKHRVAMSCKSSLCLRCAKVYVDNWGSQVSRMLHEGVIYRHIVLTVPAILRKKRSSIFPSNILGWRLAGHTARKLRKNHGHVANSMHDIIKGYNFSQVQTVSRNQTYLFRGNELCMHEAALTTLCTMTDGARGSVHAANNE